MMLNGSTRIINRDGHRRAGCSAFSTAVHPALEEGCQTGRKSLVPGWMDGWMDGWRMLSGQLAMVVRRWKEAYPALEEHLPWRMSGLCA